MGQTTIKNNFVIERSSPSLHLKGSNGVINFNSGDITLTNTSNTLTIIGGVLALPANGLLINSINHLYGLTDTITDLYYTKTATNTLLAGKQDTGVVSMTYPASGIALSTGSAWGTSITNNSTNWNTAYSDRLKWDGGSTDLVAATGRTSLGGTTVGQAFFTLTNPGAITFPRINADNTVSALSAADFKTALSLTATDVGLGNVTNESKATMFTSPAFTGSVPTIGGVNMSRVASVTASLTAGVEADVTLTGVTSEPYALWIIDSNGLNITDAVKDSTGVSGGVYHTYIYSTDAKTDCKIKVLW